MVAHSVEKVKQVFLGWISKNKADLFTALIIFLIGIASFGLGRLSASLPEKEPIRLEDTSIPASTAEQAASSTPAAKSGSYVASKSGTVYYASWCSGISRIREENKVWFQTKEEASAAGFRPAKNCPGL